MSVSEFSVNAGLGNVNLFSLVRYFEESKILQKLHGYYEARVHEYNLKAGVSVEEELSDSAVSVVQPFLSFLMCLTEAEGDGRIALYREEKTGQAKLSYQLLNASAHFKEVVEEAHAVVLAGGTMQPMTDYIQQLMPGLPAKRLRTLSVGHVVPDENILPLTLSRGPTGVAFDLRHGSRSSPALMEELARVVLNITSVVPDGVVLFLPSYSYEEELFQFWLAKGYIDKIEKKKKVLREPRESANTDAVLEEFAHHINNNYEHGRAGETKAQESAPANRCTGALLLSVVGGKLSEGINFSDGLGRCVIVAGLPFANAADPQLQERIKYITNLPAASALAALNGGDESKVVPVGNKAGQEFYQNMCMKAVNQCIGRAIRHVADYAAIILIDQRYQTEGVRGKIAAWIRKRLGPVRFVT
jgi:chromosome transmission fidelity protein 1